MRFIDAIALCALFAMGFSVTAAELVERPTVNPKSDRVDARSATPKEERQHWAFQPVHRPEPPMVQNIAWVKTPVDRFILAVLEARAVAPAPPATKEELIRRVTFDLIGLPPTPEEIDAFVADPSPLAYGKLIDRLLASPHYGERWGRHWLDLARFAESDGFEHDAVRSNAWRYRDYVVRSFNADKPHDQFIREQIAGDELWPDSIDARIATAFGLLGPDMVDSADQVQRRLNTLNDMTDTTAFAFLGLTVACARCHDHKFEPFSQKDYFQLQAFFTPVAFRNDVTVATPEERAVFDAAMADYKRQTQTERKAIDDLEEPIRKRLYEEKLAKLSLDAQTAHRTPKEQRTTEQNNTVLETAEQVKISDQEIFKAMNRGQKTQHKELQDALKKIPKPPSLPTTMALQMGKDLHAKTFVLKRGDYNNPGEEVQPGFPTVLDARKRELRESPESSRKSGHPGTPSSSAGASSASRTALAEWITSPNNPLTARVLVNRIWQHHFGRGIVPTPSDFGLQGQRPSHPELLDWLASEFIASGWSMKQMHKLITLSATYQQSSKVGRGVPTAPNSVAIGNSGRRAEDSAPYQVDPENRLFSRWQRKRLEGEAVRDSLLAISGTLNRQIGGPGVFPPIPEDVFKGATGWSISKNPEDHHRRSIYIFARRNLRFPFLEVFDAPDSNLSCPERPRSTSAPQSLTLLNADEVMAASQATAARLMKEAGSDEDRITLAYRLILGHRAMEKEQTLARAFLKTAPWSELCRALFNLNAFVYVD